MDWIYPISYLASLAGLVLWFLTGSNKVLRRQMSAVFLTSFLIYLAALAFSTGSTPYKLLILLRDTLVIALVMQVFFVLRKNVLASAGFGLAAIAILYFSYFQTLNLTFPEVPGKQLDAKGEFLIQVHPEHRPFLDYLSTLFDCTIERAFYPDGADITDLDDYYVVDLIKQSRRERKRFYKALHRHPAIIWIEPNEELDLALPESATSPRATLRKPYLNDPGIQYQWGFESMEVDRLHQLLMESGIRPLKKARIVILDTGVDAVHEDLAANYHSLGASYDSDPKGHGTHCAGIAGAVSNNGIGIASLAPTSGFVEISSIRVLNEFGMGTQKAILDGIIRAADSGADVISVSLGGFSTQSKQKAYQDAVDYATRLSAIIVVAAGNNGRNAKQTAPANTDGVIAVTAIDSTNRKAGFSNSVEDLRMGIAAPGVNVYSTLPQNKYGIYSGTSMATPQVAGLIGLMRSLNPRLTTAQAYEILKATGLPTKDNKLTGPLIQPLKAVERVMD
jgi:thermitase